MSSEPNKISDYSCLMADGRSREFIWACELTKELPVSVKWEIDVDEDDKDFLCHTLFLKQAVLGASAVNNELNIVSVETKDFYMDNVKTPIISLTSGITNSCLLDLSFSSEIPLTFRLTSGSGPVHIIGSHLVEFPPETEDAYNLQNLETSMYMRNKAAEKEASATAQQGDIEVTLNSKKRKASSTLDKKEKRKKLVVEQDIEDDGIQDDNEDEDDDDEVDSEENAEEDDDEDEGDEEEEAELSAISENSDEEDADDSDDDTDTDTEEKPAAQKSLSGKGQKKSGAKADMREKGSAEQKSTKQMKSKSAPRLKIAPKKKLFGTSSKKSSADKTAASKSRQKKLKTAH